MVIPYSYETNDNRFNENSGFNTADDFFQYMRDAFDVLYAEGEESGRVMAICLHPYLYGQPHRVKYLDQTLDYIMSHDEVWQTTADEIAEYYIAHCYDEAVAHAAWLNN